MYYEEQVIDGILHWRSTPDGKWEAFTAGQLTRKLMAAWEQLAKLAK